MHTPMFAEPLVAAALEAAEDAATEEAAVEVLEEPPQAVIAAIFFAKGGRQEPGMAGDLQKIAEMKRKNAEEQG